MRKTVFLGAAALLAAPIALSAQVTLTSADFEATPAFTDTFAGGSPAFLWELDPGNLSGAAAPQFITATPAGIAASLVASDPLASATDGGAMLMGNDSSTAGTLFGLNYVIATNSASGGDGTAFEELEAFKVVARVWTPAYADLDNPSGDRYQVGPYVYGDNTSSLFRSSMANNSGDGGVPAGGNYRGFVETAATALPPGQLAEGRWTLMSVLVQKREGEDIADASVGIDADGDGTIDELDADEFYTDLTIDTSAFPVTTFGVYTVGVISNDVFPAFVDYVEYYEPADTTPVEDWRLYN